MKRRWIIVTAIAIVVVTLALLCSLMGAMTGVYFCPGIGGLGSGNQYVVRRGDDWYWIRFGNLPVPEVIAVDRDRFDIHAGIWVMTITLRANGGTLHPYSPCQWRQFADAYRLTFGEGRSLGRTVGAP